MPRHSQMQLKVLQLYKEFLRSAENKPGLKLMVQSEFKKNAQLYPRTDTIGIEGMIRKGDRQLIQLNKSTVSNVGAFVKDN